MVTVFIYLLAIPFSIFIQETIGLGQAQKLPIAVLHIRNRKINFKQCDEFLFIIYFIFIYLFRIFIEIEFIEKISS